MSDSSAILGDPIKFTSLVWPHIRLYDKQREILYSLRDNDETIVPAGNQLGKDFVTALAVMWYFCSRSPCRIVTSSAGQTQLESVLWGEMRRLISTAKYPLPIQVNHLHIRQMDAKGIFEPLSYIRGIVSNVPENMLGHHLARGLKNKPMTLAIFDEASSIGDEYYDATETWAHRKLIIGNPLPCANFFKRYVKEGDVQRTSGVGFFRKIIKIRANQSPNVILAEQQIKAGKEPTLDILVPGVVDFPTYQKRRKLWDKIRQHVGLDAEFYEGAEVLLYPPDWLDRAHEVHKDRMRLVQEGYRRQAKSMGIDPGEGESSTVWTVVDELGIIRQFSKKTPDTSDIPRQTILFMGKYKLRAEQVWFDRGGGGKQHADYLRSRGYNVNTVGFGTTAIANKKDQPRKPSMGERIDDEETRYVYKNKRAEMYGMLRVLLNPVQPFDKNTTQIFRKLRHQSHRLNTKKGIFDLQMGFGIPDELTELRRQLAPLPLLYDAGDRLYLLPKSKKNAESKEQTLIDLLGCSPDEADSLVLATYGMLAKPPKRILTIE